MSFAQRSYSLTGKARRLAASCLVVLATASACAGFAHAQNLNTTADRMPVGNALDRRHLIEADTTLAKTAACIVKRAASQGALLLSTVPGSGAEDKIVGAMQSRLDWCMPPALHDGLVFPVGVLRGKLAEELYRTEFPGGVSPKPIKEVLAWEYPFTAKDQGDRGRMMLEQTGRCVVMRDPASVSALVATAPFSAGESRQVAAISPSLGTCMPTGSNARISRQMLRGLLAEALYEYARDVRDGSLTATAFAGKN